MFKKILLIITAIFLSINLYAENMYITWVDTIYVKDKPALSGKNIGSYTKGHIFTSGKIAGDTCIVVLDKIDYYGRWLSVKTADKKAGWVFTGALKNYFTIKGYPCYLKDKNITFFKGKKPACKIPVDNEVIDFQIDQSGNYIFIRPYKYYVEENDGVYDDYTALFIIDSSTLKMLKSFNGYFATISLSPDGNTVFIQADFIGISAPVFSQKGIMYSIKNDRVIFTGDYGVNSLWINSNQIQTVINSGRIIKDMPDPGSDYFYAETVLLDIKSGTVIHTGKFEKTADN